MTNLVIKCIWEKKEGRRKIVYIKKVWGVGSIEENEFPVLEYTQMSFCQIKSTKDLSSYKEQIDISDR